MGDGTKIAWADATWNLWYACVGVSAECDNCYARMLSPRMGIDFDGPLVFAPEDRWEQALRWRRPRKIFVNSMSDTFHSDVPVEVLARLWATMAVCPQHTFKVLTKRHGRMRSLLNKGTFEERVNSQIEAMVVDPTTRLPKQLRANLYRRLDTWSPLTSWPLPNVRLGVSAGTQDSVHLRVQPLIDTPAIGRFLSVEPLLGPVTLKQQLATGRIHQVIVGGESGRGPKIRRMDPDWARALQAECADAGVAFFFKQTGSKLAEEWGLTDPKGETMAEWPIEFQLQEEPA